MRFIQSRCNEMRKKIIARKCITKWRQFIDFKMRERYVRV